jgi:hypothetical protein
MFRKVISESRSSFSEARRYLKGGRQALVTNREVRANAHLPAPRALGLTLMNKRVVPARSIGLTVYFSGDVLKVVDG